ncbi:unnamed protein product [Paramecium sonneborni]|uniref:Uncharacterized protein n=1 Tax=Paramecium sonneborni TaxID=65129 RepID=A0A8S1L7N1_9CILI|nr:unnamed protein product [Paramecium sonneborni]
MFGKIFIYNPLLTKQQLYRLTSQFNLGANSRQMWNEYQNKGLLIQMNHSNDQALILLHQLQNKELLQLAEFYQKIVSKNGKTSYYSKTTFQKKKIQISISHFNHIYKTN